MWIVGPFVRYFDYSSAQRVDVWIANSKEVATRIEKFYRKPATVVYPPACIPTNLAGKESRSIEKRGDYYLMVSRIVGGKGIAEAAKAFQELKIPLKIVGEVVDVKLARRVESLGRLADSELADLYGQARGFVALSRDEDFGMTVVEAMAQGTPILAYNGGGYRETVISGKNGVLIDNTDTESVRAGIERMEKTKWDREEIKKSAAKFGRERFEKEIREVVNARVT